MDELRRLRIASDDHIPAEAAAYVDKVRQHAYKVVGADIDHLKAAGWTEARIFELTAGVAVDEGLRRYDAAMRAMGR
jgi:hypothetical protein